MVCLEEGFLLRDVLGTWSSGDHFRSLLHFRRRAEDLPEDLAEAVLGMAIVEVGFSGLDGGKTAEDENPAIFLIFRAESVICMFDACHSAPIYRESREAFCLVQLLEISSHHSIVCGRGSKYYRPILVLFD